MLQAVVKVLATAAAVYPASRGDAMRHSNRRRTLHVLLPFELSAVVVLVTVLAANLEGQDRAPIAAQPEPRECQRVPFDKSPDWVLSGAWSTDGSRLILSNTGPGQGTLLVYDPYGYDKSKEEKYATLERVVRDVGDTRLSALRPAPPESYLLEGFPGELFRITPGFKPKAKINLRAATPASDLAARTQAGVGLSLETTLDWTYVEGRESEEGFIVSFSDIKRGGLAHARTKDLWEGGFVSTRLAAGTPKFTYLYEPQQYMYLRRYYVTGYHYFSSVTRSGSAGKGYFVVMESNSFLQEFDPLTTEAPRWISLLELGPHMQRFADPPSIPTLNSREEYVQAFQTIEQSAMVAGLVSDGNSPFVVTREPRKDAGIEWRVTRIDPETLSPQGVFYLPTDAAHVTIIPGRRDWAVLEKGRVTDIATQSIASMVLIPSEWLSGSEPFLATRERAMEKCR